MAMAISRSVIRGFIVLFWSLLVDFAGAFELGRQKALWNRPLENVLIPIDDLHKLPAVGSKFV